MKDYNAVVFGELFEVKPAQSKAGSTYYKITLRNLETFTQLRFNCYENLNLALLTQGANVQAKVVLEPKGYTFDGKIVDVEKIS